MVFLGCLWDPDTSLLGPPSASPPPPAPTSAVPSPPAAGTGPLPAGWPSCSASPGPRWAEGGGVGCDGVPGGQPGPCPTAPTSAPTQVLRSLGTGGLCSQPLLWPSSPRGQNRREVGAQGPPHPPASQEQPSPCRRSASDSGGSGKSTAVAASWSPGGGGGRLAPESAGHASPPPPRPRAFWEACPAHELPQTPGQHFCLVRPPQACGALGCPGGPGRVQGLLDGGPRFCQGGLAPDPGSSPQRHQGCPRACAVAPQATAGSSW